MLNNEIRKPKRKHDGLGLKRLKEVREFPKKKHDMSI